MPSAGATSLLTQFKMCVETFSSKYKSHDTLNNNDYFNPISGRTGSGFHHGYNDPYCTETRCDYVPKSALLDGYNHHVTFAGTPSFSQKRAARKSLSESETIVLKTLNLETNNVQRKTATTNTTALLAFLKEIKSDITPALTPKLPRNRNRKQEPYFFAYATKCNGHTKIEHSRDDLSILLQRDSLVRSQSDIDHESNAKTQESLKILDQRRHYYHFRRGFNPNNLYFRAFRGMQESKTCSFVAKLHEIDEKRVTKPPRWKSLPDKLNKCSDKQQARMLKNFVKLKRARSRWLEKAQLASMIAKSQRKAVRPTLSSTPTSKCSYLEPSQKWSLLKLLMQVIATVSSCTCTTAGLIESPN